MIRALTIPFALAAVAVSAAPASARLLSSPPGLSARAGSDGVTVDDKLARTSVGTDLVRVGLAAGQDRQRGSGA
jgi:hypothetical protein